MEKKKEFKIAIASGKGGTGKTMVSTNLFQLLSQQGYGVTLVDCDAEEPNAMIFFKGQPLESLTVTQKVPIINDKECLFCGKCKLYCSYNAIFILPQVKLINVIEELCHGCGACFVACKYNAISEKDISLGTVGRFITDNGSTIIEARMDVGVYSPVPVIKRAIKEAGDKGIIILDSPPGTSCPFIQTVDTADYVVLVTEPTPFGLSDLKQSVETLKTIGKPFGVIVNRAGLGNKEVYEYLDREKIDLLTDIPFDKTIATDYSNGELTIKTNKLLVDRLLSVFNKLIEKPNGNSCY